MTQNTVPAPDGSGLDAPLIVPAGDLLIDGQWLPAVSGERREQLDPSNGRTLASIAIGGPADIDQAIASSAAAFPAWSNWPAQRRRDVLLELARLHRYERRRARCPALARDRRPPEAQARHVARGRVDAVLRRLGRQDRGLDRRSVFEPVVSYTVPEPYGVIAVLTPWNGGMVSAAMKVAPALAAGNTVVLKPAELAPLGPLRFAELCLEAGMPPGVLNAVPGGPEAGAALVSDRSRRQDQLHRRRRDRAADHGCRSRTSTPVVLELGGKSADLVFADADLDLAAATAVQPSLANISGQGCVLPTRLLVHEAVYDEVADKVATMASALRVGGRSTTACRWAR